MEKPDKLTVWWQQFYFCIVPYRLFQKTLKWFKTNKLKYVCYEHQTFEVNSLLLPVPEPIISWNSISESWRWKCDGKPARRSNTSAFSARETPIHGWNVGKQSTKRKALNLHWESWFFPVHWLPILPPGTAKPRDRHILAVPRLSCYWHLSATSTVPHSQTLCAMRWQHRIPYRENEFLPSVQPVLTAVAIPEPLGDMWNLNSATKSSCQISPSCWSV